MAENKKIRNLLFDLGGVIMDIERERCVEALTRLGMQSANEMLGLYVQSGPFLKLEEGEMSPEEFCNEVRRRIPGGGAGVTDAQVHNALNAFLIGIPEHRLVELRMLRKDFGIYLLSNTNPIMYHSKIAECFRAEGREMADYFDGRVTSFESHLAKPDRAIFEYAIQHLGIKPEETLFLDDSQKNLDAAAEVGFATALVPPGSEFIDALAGINLIND